MNRDEIVKLARESGFQTGVRDYADGKGGLPFVTPIATGSCLAELERFAAAIRAATKEEDARICEEKHDHWRWDDEPDSASGPRECAAAIRASK